MTATVCAVCPVSFRLCDALLTRTLGSRSAQLGIDVQVQFYLRATVGLRGARPRIALDVARLGVAAVHEFALLGVIVTWCQFPGTFLDLLADLVQNSAGKTARPLAFALRSGLFLGLFPRHRLHLSFGMKWIEFQAPPTRIDAQVARCNGFKCNVAKTMRSLPRTHLFTQ